MTADLAERLELCAHNCEEYSPHEVGTLVNGIGYLAMCALLREAASALRSSGEAVAWPDRMVNLPCPDGGTDRILGFRIPEGDPILGKFGLSEPLAWLRSVTIDRCPATPASAWRPIAEAPHSGEAVLLFQPWRSGRNTRLIGHYANGWVDQGCVDLIPNPTHWMPLPAPPILEQPHDAP